MFDYESTAWRGDAPHTYDFVIADNPKGHARRPKKLFLIPWDICGVVLIVGLLASAVSFLVAAFDSGLRLSVMMEDPYFNGLYFLVPGFLLIYVVGCLEAKKVNEEMKCRAECGPCASYMLKEGGFQLLDFSESCVDAPRLSFKHSSIKPSKWRKSACNYDNYRGVRWTEEELSVFRKSNRQEMLFVIWLPIVLLVFFGWPLIIADLAYRGAETIFVPGYVVFFVLTGALFFSRFVFAKNREYYLGDKMLSFNRRNGYVTLYEGGEIIFSHPFIEFNCFFREFYRSGKPGGWRYQIYLSYRYKDYPKDHVIDLIGFSDFENKDACMEVWGVIKCFMDVTKPLPETIFLESRREFDKTTLHHDLGTGRNPRMWRDMTDQEYSEVMRQPLPNSPEFSQ